MEKEIILPGIYTEEVWKRGGSKVEHKKYIGLHYISWSSCESFNDSTGFNTGLLGKYEYILSKMSGVTFQDFGWGFFGTQVENYITERTDEDKFKTNELETLNKIKPLGVFQDEICLYLPNLNIIVLGYIDDRTKEDENGNVALLRDYKTKSESSKKDLHSNKKHQIELYILGLQQRGLKVLEAEYCVIERGGGYECMQGGGRDVLTVKDRIWYEKYSWDEERLSTTIRMVEKTAVEVSNIYKSYLKHFKKCEV